MSFKAFLTESRVIGLSVQAYKKLSPEAKSVIDAWEYSDFKVGNALEKSVQANDKVHQELDRLMGPVRKAIPGGKIKLYRGLNKDTGSTHWVGRKLESWTDNRLVAEYFAGREAPSDPPALPIVLRRRVLP